MDTPPQQYDDKHPLVVIHNVTTLLTKDVERYCGKYDKEIVCIRKKNRYNHQYIHVLFSSIITANNFLNDRPHFIKKCRINTSLQSDPICGPNFVCVQINKYASITEDDLYEYTSRNFGHVLNCVLYHTRGYAFIEFKRLTDVHRALASTDNEIHGVNIRYLPRHDTSRIFPPLCLTRLVHIGNFSLKDQDRLQFYFPELQSFTVHQNCYGQTYILGQFDIHDSIKLLLNRAFCLNGRVLSIFIDNEDRLTECNNYLLVRHVPFRLNDYNLLEYFSQYGRVINCYRYGQTDAYRVQYRDRTNFKEILQSNRIHVIKGAQLQIENEQN